MSMLRSTTMRIASRLSSRVMNRIACSLSMASTPSSASATASSPPTLFSVVSSSSVRRMFPAVTHLSCMMGGISHTSAISLLSIPCTPFNSISISARRNQPGPPSPPLILNSSIKSSFFLVSPVGEPETSTSPGPPMIIFLSMNPGGGR